MNWWRRLSNQVIEEATEWMIRWMTQPVYSQSTMKVDTQFWIHSFLLFPSSFLLPFNLHINITYIFLHSNTFYILSSISFFFSSFHLSFTFCIIFISYSKSRKKKKHWLYWSQEMLRNFNVSILELFWNRLLWNRKKKNCEDWN